MVHRAFTFTSASLDSCRTMSKHCKIHVYRIQAIVIILNVAFFTTDSGAKRIFNGFVVRAGL